MGKRWKLLGIDFHRRWRSGTTVLDLNYDSKLVHHGFYSLEWARGPHVNFYREQRRADRRRPISPHDREAG